MSNTEISSLMSNFTEGLPESGHELQDGWQPVVALTILSGDETFVVQRSEQSEHHPNVVSTVTRRIEATRYNQLLQYGQPEMLRESAPTKLSDLTTLRVSVFPQIITIDETVEFANIIREIVAGIFDYKLGISESETQLILANSVLQPMSVTAGVVLHEAYSDTPGSVEVYPGSWVVPERNQMVNIVVQLPEALKQLVRPLRSDKYNTTEGSYGWFPVEGYKQAVDMRMPSLMGYKASAELCMIGMCNSTSRGALQILGEQNSSSK
jgi:hypothetical protein